MAQYIDGLLDAGFKIIFGKQHQSEEFLMTFLNDLFEGVPDMEKIESLEFLNNERCRENFDSRLIQYDIYCRTSTGHKFIVEMQRQPKDKFISRAKYYVYRAVVDQGVKGMTETDSKKSWDYDYIPVIGVYFANFMIKGLEPKLVTHARLCDEQTGKPIGDKDRLVFIQLPAFKKTEHECTNNFERWIYVLKNMSTMNTMPFTRSNAIFERLSRVTNYATLTGEEKMRYDYDLKKARDYAAEVRYAINEGRAEGRAEGEYEAKKKVAINLKSLGMDWDTITKATGLTASDL